MLTKTNYTVSINLLQEALLNLSDFENKIELNYPTNNFFYDKWLIIPEFKGTVWESILSSLPVSIGEARLIKLKAGRSYYSHADVDDRYHLNIFGDKSYLVDLDHNIMYPTITDGIWYSMNAGCRHSAVNFSNSERIQLVIRKPLTQGVISNPVDIKIIHTASLTNFRYIFDNIFSPWLNNKNKQGSIRDFKIESTESVSFITELDNLPELNYLCPSGFEIKL
jgi:hypothetical protein